MVGRQQMLVGLCRSRRFASGYGLLFWVLVGLVLLWGLPGGTRAADDPMITFADANLELLIRQEIQKPEGPIHRSEVATIERIVAHQAGVESLAGIEHLTNLRELSLSWSQISDISVLSSLPQLRSLTLDFNDIHDIAVLASIPHLGSLSLSGNPIEDISALASLGDLISLGLAECGIRDITALSSLRELVSLNLRRNAIADLTPVAGLMHLDSLRLGQNRLEDVSVLSHLTSLNTLDLNYNEITDVTALAHLSRLSNLNLAGNAISDLAPLESLTTLRTLNLRNTGVADVSALADLVDLQQLDLSMNHIADIAPLAHLTELERLDLYENVVLADIAPLANLVGLSELSLFANRIRDIAPLVANPGLGPGDSVSLQYNFLDLTSGSETMQHIEALVDRGVDVLFQPQWEHGDDDDDEDEPGEDLAPDRPQIIHPGDGAQDVSVLTRLEGSAYQHPGNLGHGLTQWQLFAGSDHHGQLLLDVEGAGFTEYHVPADVLDYASTYSWRVRYQCEAGIWSAWSPQAQFGTHRQPSARFQLSNTSPSSAERVQLDASSSRTGHAGGNVVYYLWDVDGSGTYDILTDHPVAEHRWPRAGSYNVRLRVVDDRGGQDAFHKRIEVQPTYLDDHLEILERLLGVTLDARILQLLAQALPDMEFLELTEGNPRRYMYSFYDAVYALAFPIDPQVPGFTYYDFLSGLRAEEEFVDAASRRLTQGHSLYMARLMENWLDLVLALLPDIGDIGQAALGSAIRSVAGEIGRAGLSIVSATYEAISLYNSLAESAEKMAESAYLEAFSSYIQWHVSSENWKHHVGNAYTNSTGRLTFWQFLDEASKADILSAAESHFAALEGTYGRYGLLAGGLLNDQAYQEERSQILWDVVRRALHGYGGFPRRQYVVANSPVAVRAYDADGRVSGVVDGQVRRDIPNSVVHAADNSVTLYEPGTVTFEVVSRGDGSALGGDDADYRLIIHHIGNDGELATFSGRGLSLAGPSRHRYQVDWDALAQGQEGVTIEIDETGDGRPDHEIVVGGQVEGTFTPEGEQVRIEYWERGGSLVFDQVTRTGHTVLAVSSSTVHGPPDGWQFVEPYYRFYSTAYHQGQVEVAIGLPAVSDISHDHIQLRLFHLTPAGDWTDVTTAIDREMGMVRGRVDTLGLFAIGFRETSEPSPAHPVFGFFVYDYQESGRWEYFCATYVADELDQQGKDRLFTHLETTATSSYVVITDVYASWRDYREAGLEAAERPADHSFFRDVGIERYYDIASGRWEE